MSTHRREEGYASVLDKSHRPPEAAPRDRPVDGASAKQKEATMKVKTRLKAGPAKFALD